MVLVPETAALRDVFLNPGDFHFYTPVPGQPRPARLCTLLGSCVSVVLWHPERAIGGMSHIILPRRGRRDASIPMDARYGDEAMALFYQEAIRAGTMPQQYFVYVVGGANMYLTAEARLSVGARNIEAARTQIQRTGFRIRAEHVGTSHHRKVELDLVHGVVTVICDHKRFELKPPESGTR